MPHRINMANIQIVLQKPRYPENIGSVARAMRNMGLSQLKVVDPEDFDLSRARMLATHEAADVLSSCQVYDDLKSALANSQYVVGTTARLGKHRFAAQGSWIFNRTMQEEGFDADTTSGA